MSYQLLVLLLLICSFLAAPTIVGAEQSAENTKKWHRADLPYRVNLKLDRSVRGRFQLDVSARQIAEALAPHAIDPATFHNVAFEDAVLIDPSNGDVAGGFVLVQDGEPLSVDGQFDLYRSDSGKSPWKRFGSDDGYRVETQAVDGEKFGALWIDSDKIINRGLKQRIDVELGRLYLLNYRLYAEPRDNVIGLQMMDLSRRLFAQEPASYLPKLPALGVWLKRSQLVQPRGEQPALQLGAAFTGRGAIGDVQLQPVRLCLAGKSSHSVDQLSLYLNVRGGHRLPSPDKFSFERATRKTKATVTSVRMQPLNSNGLLMAQEGASLWTLPNDAPLRAGWLRRLKPDAQTSESTSPAVLRLFKGGSQTLLFAVDLGTATAHFDKIELDMPIEVDHEFRQMAEIPIMDGPHPIGKQIDSRLDPMSPINFDLIPSSSSGVHVVAVTVRTGSDTPAGIHRGRLNLHVKNAEPRSFDFQVPIELRVADVTIQPTRHFAAMFGGQHLLVRYPGSSPAFTHDSTSVADFHGMGNADLAPNTVVSLSMPDKREPRAHTVRDLARKYAQDMLDHSILPKAPTLYSAYTYRISEQGENKAPTLSDWDFTEYNEAIDQLVIGRDMPWLTICHTNGHLMDHFRLSNGVTYTISDKPKAGWRSLPRDEYLKLIGDYFDAIAAHLDAKGVLDRTLIVVDESSPTTYALMRDWVMSIKSRPYGRGVTVCHTTHKTSTWTQRDERGELVLGKALDIPVPQNDDYFSFFQSDLARIWQEQGKRSWVYYVSSEHISLDAAGLSTILTPLKLRHYGVDGWYIWASFIWSMPYPIRDVEGFRYPSGPVINPWQNPFYHHGPGVLSYYYPPDPRGVSPVPTDRIIRSYRLAQMREGMQLRAIHDVLARGRDDAGKALSVDRVTLGKLDEAWERLWTDNPVQWRLSYHDYRAARDLLWQTLFDVD